MIKARLVFEVEYEEDEVESDPKELLLEVLAAQPDSFLIDCIEISKNGDRMSKYELAGLPVHNRRNEMVRDHQDRRWVKIDGAMVWTDEFAWDGCHKIYLVTDQDSRDKLEGYGYNFFDIEELQEAWEASCGLRFISDASLNATYVPQGEDCDIDIKLGEREVKT